MSWADLDKLAAAKRPDGTTTLVARDDRTAAEMFETKHLSIIVAISRVIRGRRVAEQGGRVVYLTTTAPPFLVDAVTAAGAVVFDGKREHVARSPLATTVQLDAAFCDPASVVRRRLDARSFRDALDTLERDVRRTLPERTNAAAFWTAIIELAALTGEVLREKRAARWIEAPTQRFPLALDLGKGELMFPGKLAQAIVEGGAGSMRELIAATEPPKVVPIQPAFALLCDRRTIPIDKLTWERLVSEEVDTEEVPVIVYVEDHGGTIHWPVGATVPAPARRAAALANLAKEPVAIDTVDMPSGHTCVFVIGGFYAAESLLVPATMAKVRAELGAPTTMLVGVPARGHLLAVHGERATLDDDLRNEFVLLVDKAYHAATERDRISTAIIVYIDAPVGHLETGLAKARRALRSIGVDPDDPGDDSG